MGRDAQAVKGRNRHWSAAYRDPAKNDGEVPSTTNNLCYAKDCRDPMQRRAARIARPGMTE